MSSLSSAYESIGRWAEAEALRRDVLARRGTDETDSLLLAGELAGLGFNLLNQSKWSEAERVLRECLAIRENKNPDDWSRFNAMSLVGWALLGQAKYAEAEPLIVQGYEGLKAREVKIPVPARPRLLEAAERVIRLYEAWGKPEQAAVWNVRLGLADLPSDVFANP